MKRLTNLRKFEHFYVSTPMGEEGGREFPQTRSAMGKSKIKINENVDENQKVIEDSYNDYISLNDERQKEIVARHIKRTAQGFIRNSGGRLEDWLEKFKDEDIVISKLKEL